MEGREGGPVGEMKMELMIRRKEGAERVELVDQLGNKAIF